jgi:hypothetical protein
MYRGKFTNAFRPNSISIKAAVIGLIAIAFVLASTSSTAYAAKKVKYGQLEISTNPGGFPLRIDGQAQGDTSTTVRVIELQPGHHNIEILLPNGGKWVRDFDIERARKVCVNLNYHPKKYTVTKSPCPYPVNISAPVSVNDGDLITFTSDVAYSGTAPLTYTWTVSPADARIVSGAGTATITVDSTNLGNQRVMATLVVDDGSGDALCRQTAQGRPTSSRRKCRRPNARCSTSSRRWLSMTTRLVWIIWPSSYRTQRTRLPTSSSMAVVPVARARQTALVNARWIT